VSDDVETTADVVETTLPDVMRDEADREALETSGDEELAISDVASEVKKDNDEGPDSVLSLV
jgi:hypothetical protein